MNHNNNVEQWLDSALGQYASTEPRAGLEGRILATLSAERRRMTQRKRWWWASAGTVAAAAAIALAVWLGHNDHAHAPGGGSMTARRDAGPQPRPMVSPEVHPFTPPAQRATIDCLVQGLCPVHARRSTTAPRLDQFPAPAPLSDQEKLLARYVQQFPQRAALIARAQTELQQRTELEMAEPWPNNADFNHQERQQ